LEELVKVMERKSYNELEIYTEISLMSKELRDSILQISISGMNFYPTSLHHGGLILKWMKIIRR